MKKWVLTLSIVALLAACSEEEASSPQTTTVETTQNTESDTNVQEETVEENVEEQVENIKNEPSYEMYDAEKAPYAKAIDAMLTWTSYESNSSFNEYFGLTEDPNNYSHYSQNYVVKSPYSQFAIQQSYGGNLDDMEGELFVNEGKLYIYDPQFDDYIEMEQYHMDYENELAAKSNMLNELLLVGEQFDVFDSIDNIKIVSFKIPQQQLLESIVLIGEAFTYGTSLTLAEIEPEGEFIDTEATYDEVTVEISEQNGNILSYSIFINKNEIEHNGYFEEFTNINSTTVPSPNWLK